MDLSQAAVAVVLTKAPSVGGKTRLFAGLRRPPDPVLLWSLLLDTLDGVAAPGVRRLVAVEPADACGEMYGRVPPDVLVMPQPSGDLGERMRRVMDVVLGAGARCAMLVGSDLPHITPEPVLGAAAMLERHPGDVVIGPASDGGYYLIAATRTPELFAGIEWGTPRVLQQTLATARRQGIRMRFADTMHDIDTPADLRRVVRDPRHARTRTAAWARANGMLGPPA